MRAMKMELVCNGEVVNKHSDGGQHYDWDNPLDVLPPVNSIIDYMTFNQKHKEGKGVLTSYRVTGYRFYTEEDFNHSYYKKVCQVFVEKVE